jgi:hypothetical protein
MFGHSMGGLVAKLQVTESSDLLWRAAATQPIHTVKTSSNARQVLQEAFFFRPSLDIKRVVFLGTPHLGSTWARRPIGRIGSALVEPAPEATAQHQQLMQDNPNLLREELRDRFPTSVDLLEPKSPLLAATAVLPFSPTVRLHSIIGTGHRMWNGVESDGVVPVTSSRLLGVASEMAIVSKHDHLQRDPRSVVELVRILRLHLK